MIRLKSQSQKSKGYWNYTRKDKLYKLLAIKNKQN